MRGKIAGGLQNSKYYVGKLLSKQCFDTTDTWEILGQGCGT